MALFDYTGQLQSGRAFQGTLEADSRPQAEATLADMGVRITSLRATKRNAYVAPLSLDDLLLFNEQLAGLTRAQLPLEEGLRQLAADVGSGKLKRLLLELADDLRSGVTLEQALERQQARFPTEYADVVKAGLQTGDLGGVLHGLSTHLRLKSSSRRALFEVTVYPLTILVFAMLVLSFVMHSIVPNLRGLSRELWSIPISMGVKQLPPLVEAAYVAPRVIFSVAAVWIYVEVTAIALAGAILMFYILTLLPGGRRLREWMVRRIPGIGQVYWSSVLARFAHTSALGAFSGTPLPDLLRAGGASSGSPSLSDSANRIAARVEQGTPLLDASSGERNLPRLWSYVVDVASRRGDLPASLQELAQTYEVRARRWADAVRIIVGPLLFLVVGGVIATTALGIVLALGGVIGSLSSF